MADRTSAGIFGDLFVYLAERPQSMERDALAKHLWNMTNGYDFTPDQMGVDKILIQMGFAYRAPDEQYPDDGDYTQYRERS